MSEDSDSVKIAEVVREVIGCLGSLVQLPREQRREWIKTLDGIIYGPEED